MDIIKSKENELVKSVKKLLDKKYRKISSKFIIEGFRFTEEALKSDFHVETILVSETSRDKWNSYDFESKVKSTTRVYWISNSVMKYLSDTETPQGVLAVVEMKENKTSFEEGFYVLADKIQDPGNLGTIIRTAHACGALGVLLTKGTVDVYNNKTLRSTMGSIFNVPVIEDEDLQLLNSLRENGFKLIVSALDADINFYDINLKGRYIIAVGNEGNGISSEIMQIGDIKAKLPMPGNAESLNAAVAISVMMYEAVRQKLR
ncbi:MAG: methyltransferase [Clostridiaceae bacterium]|jgi:TrmH family RNA methyltransferase|nr:methyltransferase [Clostridiaceae bacterium]